MDDAAPTIHHLHRYLGVLSPDAWTMNTRSTATVVSLEAAPPRHEDLRKNKYAASLAAAYAQMHSILADMHARALREVPTPKMRKPAP